MKLFILSTLWLLMLISNRSFCHSIKNDGLKWNKSSVEFLNDTIVETVHLFPNGTIQTRTKSYFDSSGIEYKKIEEGFRKNGTRKYVVVLADVVYTTYSARYNKHDKIIVEKEYTYNAKGTLINMKTTKNGSVSNKTFETDPEGNSISGE